MSNIRKKKIIFLISCIIKIITQEVGMAFLPIFFLGFICAMMDHGLPVLTIYNNLFIGFVTLNMGNILYLNKDCKKIDENIKSILNTISFIGLIFSVIAYVITSLEELDIHKSRVNDFYWLISILLVVAIFLTELFKIDDEYRRKKKKIEQSIT